ncbi:Uncharacterised protein [Bordetella pertussis]|nr:Uncharacterised protein [Bordetella pertussis]CFW11964.1 Uncharacterised protein [Bordetella pertussis]
MTRAVRLEKPMQLGPMKVSALAASSSARCASRPSPLASA